MSAGTTTDFEQSRDEIIQDALALVAAAGPDQPVAQIQGTVRSHAARALNRIVKARDPEGLFLWRVIRRSFTTTAGTAAYLPATDVIAVDEPMSFKAASQDSRTPVVSMSRDDYMNLSNRVTQSRAPTFFFVEKTLAQPVTVNFWPVPSTSGDSIEYAAVLRSKDFDTAANTPDFPPQFTKALVLELGAELALVYGAQLQLASFLNKRADEEWAKQLMAETEMGNLTLVPWGGGM